MTRYLFLFILFALCACSKNAEIDAGSDEVSNAISGGIEASTAPASPMTAGMSITSSGGTVLGGDSTSVVAGHATGEPAAGALASVGGQPEAGQQVAGALAAGTNTAGSLTAGVPIAGQSASGDASAGSSTVEEPIAGVLIAGEPIAGASAGGSPTAGLSAAGQQAAGQVVSGTPAGGAPTAGMPHAGQPSGGQLSGGILAGGQPEMGGLPAEPGCVPPVAILQYTTWPAAFGQTCINCHVENGQAHNQQVPLDAAFIFKDPRNPGRGETVTDVFEYNLQKIRDYSFDVQGEPYLLLRATGGAGHPPGRIIEPGSDAYRAIADLLAQIDLADAENCDDAFTSSADYGALAQRFHLRSFEETYRVFTVQTLGRLPTALELSRIRNAGRQDAPMFQAEARAVNAADAVAKPVASSKAQFHMVQTLIGEAVGERGFHLWLKDVWNDVFMFRGAWAQDFDRAYDVFNPHDFGARVWSDFCDVKVPLTDEAGNFLAGTDDEIQPFCDLQYERFNYTPVDHPAVVPPDNDTNLYEHYDNFTAQEACDYCAISRYGMAYWMKYGAIEEPLELIARTVKENRPFTEILTSQDLMMNYYTSLVYFGTADPAENQFTADMDDVPMFDGVKYGPSYPVFDALFPDHRVFKPIDRMRRTHYQSFDIPDHPRNGRRLYFREEYEAFPRAGILTSAAFMRRFPSSDLNMNRHRAWQTMRLLLDFDVLLNQGARLSLAAFDDPNAGATVSNPDCASCHEVLDGVSGLFQDFGPDGASKNPNSGFVGRWPAILHPPTSAGIGGVNETFDRNVHGAPIQFLARKIIADPRFARTMVRHAWKQVMGTAPLDGALHLDDDDFRYKSALVLSQQRFIQNLVTTFERDFDMMTVYRRLFTSVWYRLKGLKPRLANGPPDSAYEGAGRFGTVTPEEYMRRIEAVYGAPWPIRHHPQSSGRTAHYEELYHMDFFTRTDSGLRANGGIRGSFDFMMERIDDNFSAFFGGIDFQNNLKRAEQMDSIMSLVASRVANEFACVAVYPDFQRPVEERRFFGHLSGAMDRNNNQPTDEEMRATVVHLFQRFLGLSVEAQSQEVDLVIDLWTEVRDGIVEDRSFLMPKHCGMTGAQGRNEANNMVYPDVNGHIRAWMAVVTYLMLQPEFIQR